MDRIARETGRQALITMIGTELGKSHPDPKTLSKLATEFLKFARGKSENDFALDLEALDPARRILRTNELIQETIRWAKGEFPRLFGR